MRSRLEELATENSQLHRTVEVCPSLPPPCSALIDFTLALFLSPLSQEKTDKALDAWAALHVSSLLPLFTLPLTSCCVGEVF
jgi:hypothetical protein